MHVDLRKERGPRSFAGFMLMTDSQRQAQEAEAMCKRVCANYGRDRQRAMKLQQKRTHTDAKMQRQDRNILSRG